MLTSTRRAATRSASPSPSPSPSPQTNIDSVMDEISAMDSLFNESSSPQPTTTIIDQLGQPVSNTKSKKKSKFKKSKKTLNVPNDQNTNGNNTDHLDSNEDSLHEMVQSILDDSDNDVVLNNWKGLGYDKMIPYNSIPSKSDNQAQIYRHPPIHNPSSPRGNESNLFPPIDV